MNILFLTLLDFYDLDASNIYSDLMQEFISEGHKVNIISPIEKNRNTKTHLIEKSTHKILKLKIGSYQKTNFIRKGISTLLIDAKFKHGIKKYFCEVKIDLLLYSTPPISFTKSIKYVKNRYDSTTYLLLKDIFPQNAIDLGIIKKKGIMSPIYYYFRKKEMTLYGISDYIGCMSIANKQYIINHNSGLNPEKIEICPNSIVLKEKQFFLQKELDNFRIQYDIPINKTVFLYGGNLGKPQGIDFIMECISKNEENDNCFILIVGSGTEYSVLENFYSKNKIKNSKLLSYLSKNEYDKLVNACDVGLIFLDSRFTIPNFPSRILSYMEASKPILAATDIHTDLGTVITEGNFGVWCKSGDLVTFNDLLNTFTDSSLTSKLGKNSRKYLEENYNSKVSYNVIIKHFQEVKN